MNHSATRESITIDLLRHATRESLSDEDVLLLKAAHDAALRAYAPYSKFFVGAALRMQDGSIITGNNQENASFPAGICAERTAIHAVMSQWPQAVIKEIAVVVPQVKGGTPVSPCGICRQAMVEQESRQQQPLRLLLGLAEGPVLELASASSLLPLSFDSSFL